MTPRERLFALEQFGIKLGLENILALVTALDRPDRAWASVHVAGTNGKGSVTAMIERGLRAAGHRTGRYTSPHLAHIEERIAIDGQPIDRATFDRATSDVLNEVDRLQGTGMLATSPTFFEVTTAVAFEIFRRRNVSVGIIEVGLGGRFDATNVIVPRVSAITSIALDHERHLGRTLSQIAAAKAGIIKSGVPVVVGAMPDVARDVIVEEARKAGAPCLSAGLEHIDASQLEEGRAVVRLRTPARRYPALTLGLNGAHQIANAVVAARTLEMCADRGLNSRAEDVVTALSDVEWPARLEWLRTEAHQHVLIDAAHNPAGAAALADYVASANVGPLPLVLAVMKDKDIDAILRALAPVASRFVATEVDSPRALRSSDLAARITRVIPTAPVASCADWDDALALALAEGRRACVTGSIFLAGPLRARLVERGAVTIDRPV